MFNAWLRNARQVQERVCGRHVEEARCCPKADTQIEGEGELRIRERAAQVGCERLVGSIWRETEHVDFWRVGNRLGGDVWDHCRSRLATGSRDCFLAVRERCFWRCWQGKFAVRSMANPMALTGTWLRSSDASAFVVRTTGCSSSIDPCRARFKHSQVVKWTTNWCYAPPRLRLPTTDCARNIITLKDKSVETETRKASRQAARQRLQVETRTRLSSIKRKRQKTQPQLTIAPHHAREIVI